MGGGPRLGKRLRRVERRAELGKTPRASILSSSYGISSMSC